MKNCLPHVTTLLVGVSYLHAVLASLISLAVGGGLGWYARGRGVSGMEIDMTNIKNDISNLKAKVLPTIPSNITFTNAPAAVV